MRVFLLLFFLSFARACVHAYVHPTCVHDFVFLWEGKEWVGGGKWGAGGGWGGGGGK